MLVPALGFCRKGGGWRARREEATSLLRVYFAPHISYALAKEANVYFRILFVFFCLFCFTL